MAKSDIGGGQMPKVTLGGGHWPKVTFREASGVLIKTEFEKTKKYRKITDYFLLHFWAFQTMKSILRSTCFSSQNWSDT